MKKGNNSEDWVDDTHCEGLPYWSTHLPQYFEQPNTTEVELKKKENSMTL